MLKGGVCVPGVMPIGKVFRQVAKELEEGICYLFFLLPMYRCFICDFVLLVSAAELRGHRLVQVLSTQMESQFLSEFGTWCWLFFLPDVRWQVAGWVFEWATWRGQHPGHFTEHGKRAPR